MSFQMTSWVEVQMISNKIQIWKLSKLHLKVKCELLKKYRPDIHRQESVLKFCILACGYFANYDTFALYPSLDIEFSISLPFKQKVVWVYTCPFYILMKAISLQLIHLYFVTSLFGVRNGSSVLHKKYFKSITAFLGWLEVLCVWCA